MFKSIQRRALLSLPPLLLAAVLISAVVCRVHIGVTPYTVELEGLSGEVRLVLVSDLHGMTFGRDNARLVGLIEGESPDFIAVDGDMIDRDAPDEDVRSMLSLISELLKIAPVYFAPGNHEDSYIEKNGTALLDAIREAGATVLNDSFVDVTHGGAALRIGATTGHGFPFGRTWAEFEASDEYVFLKEMEKADVPTVVMAHMPDTFIFNSAAEYWSNIDLVLSGHTHGGVIRLPFVGGVYAPMQEFFPYYDKGHFYLDDKMQMIVTAGLAGYEWVPRLFNPPEICTVTLIPKK